jgi:hypothetical protein
MFYLVYKPTNRTGYVDGWCDTPEEAMALVAMQDNPYSQWMLVVEAQTPQEALRKAGIRLYEEVP